MTAEELIRIVKGYHRDADENLISRAYEFSRTRHSGQKRLTGDEFFTHPVAVARILAEHRQDDLVIAAGLLHDTVEDTSTTYEEIEDNFGKPVAAMVNGVTKVRDELGGRYQQSNGRLQFNDIARGKTLKRILDAAGKYNQVAIVKCADRLHNLKTPPDNSQSKQRLKALESIELYAPLAEMCGFQKIQQQLEDVAFGILQPDEMKEIKRQYVQLRGSKRDPSHEVITAQLFHGRLCRKLKAARIEAEVTGRLKAPYSTWRKYKDQIISADFSGGRVRPIKEWLNSVFDVFGFRIVTENDEDVYRALGVIHQSWPAVRGRFKDYVSVPKAESGYQSIHTAVEVPRELLQRSTEAMQDEALLELPEHYSVEIQIRTREMHFHAEFGEAAHWAYRNGMRLRDNRPGSGNTLQTVIDETLYSGKGEIPDAEFKNRFRSAISFRQSSIACYTPRNRLIRLPKKATALDFAFAVHSKIGQRAVAAKVRGRKVALNTMLQDGDTVQIVTAVDASPKPAWLGWVTTSRAKAELRRALRDIERQHLMTIGLKIAQEALKQYGEEASDSVLKIAADKVLKEGGDVEQLLLQLGRSAEERERAIHEPDRGGVAGRSSVPNRQTGTAAGESGRGATGLTGEDLVKAILPEPFHAVDPEVTDPVNFFVKLPDGLMPHIAPCCLPVPKEEVVGVCEGDGQLLVHRTECDNIDWTGMAGRLVEHIDWKDGKFVPIHPAGITASLANRAGVLGRICNLIGEHHSNISDIEFLHREQKEYLILFEIQVRDCTHLDEVMSAIRSDVEVKFVFRSENVSSLKADLKAR